VRGSRRVVACHEVRPDRLERPHRAPIRGAEGSRTPHVLPRCASHAASSDAAGREPPPVSGCWSVTPPLADSGGALASFVCGD